MLRTVALDSGAQTAICPLSGLALARWSDDGTIAFTDSTALFRVPETGGSPELLVRPDAGKGEESFFGLDPLPGGGLLVGVLPKAGSGNRPHVSALAPGTRELKVVLDGSSGASFAGGALVYRQVKGLTATPFDVDRLETTGPPIVIEPGGTNLGGIGVARNGTFAYVRRPDASSNLFRIALLSPTGEPTKTIADDVELPRHPRASPDGRRLAIAAGPGNFASVWIYDLTGVAQPVKLTQARGASEFPVWSHDATQLALLSRMAAWRMTSIPTDGSALEPKEILGDPNEPVPQSWSADGKILVYQVTDIQNGADLMELDAKSGKTRPWLQTRSNEREARFSPDGRWVAYASDQDGRFQVWVRASDQSGGAIRISSDGGHEPAWSHDGHTIFYLAGPKMMAAKFDGSGTRASAAPPRTLFEGGFLPYNAIRRRPYDVLPDGRFVVIQRVRPVVRESIVIVLNALPAVPHK